MLKAADAALKHSDSLPNALFVISERSPNAKGTGRVVSQDGIKPFPGDRQSQFAQAPAEHRAHAASHQ